MTTATSRTSLQWLVIGLAAANLIVAAAWLGKDRLVAAGILASPPPARVLAGAWPMPAIAAEPPNERAAESAPPKPDDAASEAGDQGADAPAPLLTCVLAGPFNDPAAAEALRAGIEAGSVRVVEDTVAGAPDYLVYIEVVRSRNLAQRTVQDLKAQNIDAYIIPSGARENAISVGVFTVHKWATAQRDRIRGLGYATDIAELERRHSVYRVEIRNVPPAALADTPFEPCDAGAVSPEPQFRFQSGP